MNATRFSTNPLLTINSDASLDGNINGPSVIRVPDWIPNPLGKYYLYFAHHHGKFIRLAYSDAIEGPWKIHLSGTLRLRQSGFRFLILNNAHIASPDVHVDVPRKRIVMFYHGGYTLRPPRGLIIPSRGDPEDGGKLSRSQRLMYRQSTRVCESRDGLNFSRLPGIVGLPYWRRFEWNGSFYAISMPGVFYHSPSPCSGYQPLPIELFTPRMRHAAVAVEANLLHVYYTNVGDAPEQVLRATISLDPDCRKWSIIATTPILKPQETYEGADLPIEISKRGQIDGRARQLRDPFVFTDNGRRFLFYCGAGEQTIAAAELVD